MVACPLDLGGHPIGMRTFCPGAVSRSATLPHRSGSCAGYRRTNARIARHPALQGRLTFKSPCASFRSGRLRSVSPCPSWLCPLSAVYVSGDTMSSTIRTRVDDCTCATALDLYIYCPNRIRSVASKTYRTDSKELMLHRCR